MLLVLAAATVAAASPPPAVPAPAAAAVESIEVVAQRAVVGDLKQGIQAYRPDYFVQVRPGTALDMVQWLPGFTFEEMRDLRGLGGAAGNVLIDGQPPTSKNDTLASVLRRIPAAQVERVDLIVGGAPGIDMRGRSVIANVVLKKGAMPVGAVTASSQLYQDGRVSPELLVNLSRKTGDRVSEGSFTLAKRVLQSTGVGTGPLVRRDATGAALFEADSQIAGEIHYASGSGALQFPWAGGKLKLSASAIYQDAAADERAQVVGAPALYSIDVLDHYRQGEIGLRYERPLGRATLETQLLQRRNGHDQRVGTVRPPVVTELVESDTLSETVGRGVLRFSPNPKLTLEASAEAALNHLDTEGEFRSDGQRVVTPGQDVSINERRAEIGTLATWKPTSSFSLTTALKLETSRLSAEGDVNLTRELTYLKPRLVASWSPDGRTQLRLRAEHEVDQIRFNNFVSSIDAGIGQLRAGNPNLRPRRAWVAEAQIERQIWTGASIVLTARQSKIRDVLERLPAPGSPSISIVGNAGDGDQIEFVAAVTLPLKRIGLNGVNVRGGFTLRKSEVIDPTTGLSRDISGQYRRIADLHLSHDLPRLKLTWGADLTYVGSVAVYQPATIERVTPIAKLSAFIEYRARPDLNLRLEAFNLADARPNWTVETYAGLRGAAPLRYAEIRRTSDGPYLYLRVRKSLS